MGLNRFGGQVDAQFPIGPLAMTRMAGPPELMRQEDTILEHLQEANTIEVTEDGMALGLDGLLLVVLERTETGISDVPS
jgi:heat shock protein HslJ